MRNWKRGASDLGELDSSFLLLVAADRSKREWSDPLVADLGRLCGCEGGDDEDGGVLDVELWSDEGWSPLLRDRVNSNGPAGPPQVLDF